MGRSNDRYVGRRTLIAGLVACTRRGRAELEEMEPEELADAANAAPASLDEIVEAASSPPVEVEGVLADAPGADGSGEGLAVQGRGRTLDPFSASAEGDPEDVDLDFEVRNVLAGPPGEAAVDGDDEDDSAANAGDRGDDAPGDGELDFEVEGVLTD